MLLLLQLSTTCCSKTTVAAADVATVASLVFTFEVVAGKGKQIATVVFSTCDFGVVLVAIMFFCFCGAM